jgi:hypothetical protein
MTPLASSRQAAVPAPDVGQQLRAVQAGLEHERGRPQSDGGVQVADSDAYERWLTTRLLGDPAIARVDSRITMKMIKSLR